MNKEQTMSNTELVDKFLKDHVGQWTNKQERELYKLIENTRTNDELLCAVAEISSMCVGEIAMGHKLDAEYIGQMIYKATGLSEPELREAIKELDKCTRHMIKRQPVLEIELHGYCVRS